MLNVTEPGPALELILENITDAVCTESVSLADSLGRICAQDLISPEDLPAFSRSTVDGYAVCADDTYGCSDSIPAMLICDGEIKMGELPSATLKKGHCMRIATGGGLPEGSDAVSMIEYTDDPGDEFRYVYKPVSKLENVNSKGDDVRKGSIVLHEGDTISSRSIAVLAALGIADVTVFKEIRAGIISTGDELVEYTETPSGAQIRNINSVMLAAQVREAGAIPVVYPIVKDDFELLKHTISSALSECDLLLISGGSSVGEKDNTFKALAALGDVLFHGISIKPGKPTIFAMCTGKPVFGLPGHPQAAYFIFRLFAAPAIYKMLGAKDPQKSTECILSANIPSNHGREEIMPVRIEGGSAIPLHSRSGMVSVLSAADGYIRVPRDAEGLMKGSAVKVFLMKDNL